MHLGERQSHGRCKGMRNDRISMILELSPGLFEIALAILDTFIVTKNDYKLGLRNADKKLLEQRSQNLPR